MQRTLHFQSLRFQWSLERELDQVSKQQASQQKAVQTVQDQNNGKLAILRDEIRLTRESQASKNQIRYLCTHFLYAWTYLHSGRCVAML